MNLDLIFGGMGALLIALGIPLALGRVGPNRWYGFRVPATLRDQGTWYAVNALAGKDLIATGVILLVLVLTMRSLADISPTASALAFAVALVIGAVAGTVRGYRLAGRLAQSRAGTPGRNAE